MLYSLYHKQPSEIISAAVGCFLEHGKEVLLIASRCDVQVWGVAGDDFDSCPLSLLAKCHMFASILACVRIPSTCNAPDLLLVIAEPGKWYVVRWNERSCSFETVSSMSATKSSKPVEGNLSIAPEIATHLHPDGVLVTWRQGPSEGEHLVLVSYWMDTFHLFTIREQGAHVSISVRVSRDSAEYALKAGIPGPESQLIHWAFLQPPNDLDFEDCPMVVLLFVDASDVVQIECAAIKPSDDDHGTFDILQGPWGVTNVQPTAHTILPCSATLGGGCLCLSPNSVIAVGDQGHRGRVPAGISLVCAAPLGPVSVHGKQTSTTCWLLGTKTGEVYALLVSPEKLSPNCRMELVPLSLETKLSVPTSMHIVSDSSRTLLVWVAASGHTSVLLVEMPQEVEGGSTPAPTVRLLYSPFERSLGPIHHAIAIDELGAGETDLILACGTFGDGCVRHCRLGLGVDITVDDGPELHGCTRILSLAVDPGANAHSHLLFSFDEEEETQVLALDGHDFKPAVLPGFEHSAATLLAMSTPDGHLVQVTPLSVRVAAKGGGAVRSWAPRVGRIAKASAAEWRGRSRLVREGVGAVVAVGVGCAVHLLAVSESGEVEERGRCPLDNQVSALAVKVEAQAGGAAQGVHVAVGEWVSNAVSVVAGWQLSPAARTAGAGTPVRSLAWWEPGDGADRAGNAGGGGGGWGRGGLLVAGFGDGTARWIEVKEKEGEGDTAAMEVGEGFRVGDTAVQVEPMGEESVRRGRGGRLHLHSSMDAVWAAGSMGGGVHCARVCGAGGSVAVSSLHTELMPDSLVWLDEGSKLHFGQVHREVGLQWEERALGDSVVGMVHDSAHRCLVALTEPTRAARPGGCGGGAMRLMQAGSLEEVWRLDLEACQAWSAIAIREGAAAGAGGSGRGWLSRLVFVASYVTGGDEGVASRGSEAGGDGEEGEEELTRKEVGIVSAFEVLGPEVGQGGSVSERERWGMRLVGLVEVGAVVTALEVVGEGRVVAAAGGQMVEIACTEVEGAGEGAGGGARASRQGLQGIDELWVRCEMRVEGGGGGRGRGCAAGEVPEKVLRAVSARGGVAWGVQVLGGLVEYGLGRGGCKGAGEGGIARRRVDCGVLGERMGELSCCRLLGGGRGLLGGAAGTLAVVDVEEEAGEVGEGSGVAAERRYTVAASVDLRSGPLSAILPGQMGLRSLPRAAGGDARGGLAGERHFVFATAGGAVGSIAFVDAELGSRVLRLSAAFAAKLVPFVMPTHRHAWPRRNDEKDGVGDGLGGSAAIDGEVLRQLLLSCAPQGQGAARTGTGIAPAKTATDALKEAGVGLDEVLSFLAAAGNNAPLSF